MPKDLLFTYDFPPIGGGIARCMEALALGYPKGSLVVSTGSVAESDISDARFPNQVDRIAVSSNRLRTVPGLRAWSSRAVELARNPDISFSWCGTLRPAAYPAWWARKRTGVQYGVMVYGGDLLILEKKLQRSIWKRHIVRTWLRDAEKLVAISGWTAKRLVQLCDTLNVKDARVKMNVVSLGTDVEHWQPNSEAAAQFRHQRNLPAGRWLVTVARLVPHKGIDTGIRVLAALLGEFPDLQYAIVGRGPYEQELRKLALSLGVADRVHFLTDVVDADLPASYALGDIYLGLSRETETDVEGFGISLIEASAMKLPVVAGRSGGIPDAVKDGVTGILVEPNSPDSAIGTVRSLLNNPARMQEMGELGRERVQDQFTWEYFVKRMRSIASETQRRS